MDYTSRLVRLGTNVRKCNFIVILGGRDGESFLLNLVHAYNSSVMSHRT